MKLKTYLKYSTLLFGLILTTSLFSCSDSEKNEDNNTEESQEDKDAENAVDALHVL